MASQIQSSFPFQSQTLILDIHPASFAMIRAIFTTHIGINIYRFSGPLTYFSAIQSFQIDIFNGADLCSELAFDRRLQRAVVYSH